MFSPFTKCYISLNLLVEFVLKVVVTVPETSLLVVLGCGLVWVVGPNFFLWWVGLG